MLQNNFKIGKSFTLYSALPSSDSLYIATSFLNNQQNTLLVICQHSKDVSRLQQELKYFLPQIKVNIFADRELLPYDKFSPHSNLVSERLLTLYELWQQQGQIILASINTVIEKIAPLSFIAQYSFKINLQQKFDLEKFKQQMIIGGYNHVTTVMHNGEYCLRGGIIDIFPMGSVLPYRIDLFDDTVDSIKVFNIDSQRSLYNIDSINILPSKEFPFDEEARTIFLNNFVNNFNSTQSIIYQNMRKGVASSGIEFYIPLFFNTDCMTTLFDYIPNNSHIITIGDVEQSIKNFNFEADKYYKTFSHDLSYPLLKPQQLYINQEQFFINLQKFAHINLKQDQHNSKSDNNYSQIITDIYLESKRDNQHYLDKFKNFCISYNNYKIIICAEGAGRLDSLQILLDQAKINYITLDNKISLDEILTLKSGIYLQVNAMQNSFIQDENKLIFINEENLLPNYIRKTSKPITQQQDITNIIRDLSEIEIDDIVVHSQYGLGKYNGLIELDNGNGTEEFVHIKYANDTNLYVPIQNLNLISRYAGFDTDNINLNTLGSDKWEKAKRKAAEQIYDTAAELLQLYAEKSLIKGEAINFSAIKDEYQKFANSFGFNTTVDQENAIQNVIQDLSSDKPMERLVCGDVGFGKTEVAMRAAFISAYSGKQVLILAPTTLLAEQHYNNFINRFSPWALNIAEFSRFKTPKELKENIQKLNAGLVDIAIGTHKLLGAEIKPPKLGLIIVDEEHRFGVRQKELIKNMRKNVDILSLTATPIPRTLGMALEGIRSLSIIASAPQKRLSVKTFVQVEDKSIIREAILREIKRGGQVYFVHNDIESINYRKQMLEEIVPECSIQIAHGQLSERELEQVMKDFHHQKFNVLLCTTIIETGLDIANANTIILHRADKFGLAQLHQLRGRVGRSHHQAYAYMLIHDFKALTANSKKRLEAIASLQELGSGFFLAMQDLEIRGAGEFLGEKQSGEMQKIGFNLYSDMLNSAINALKNGQSIDILEPYASNISIDLGSAAILPNNYIEDVSTRLSLYNKLSLSTIVDEIYEIKDSIIDKYGKLPLSAELLIYSHLLRLEISPMGVNKISTSKDKITINLLAKNNINPQKFILMLQNSKDIILNNQNSFSIKNDELSKLNPQQKFNLIINSLYKLN